MSIVYASISISLDGYYVGPNPSPDKPMGDSGALLHSWFSHTVADRQQPTTEDILREDFDRLGAMVMGRDSYEHAQGVWGPRPPFEVPIFVLTHYSTDADVREGTTFHFVTDGFDAALALASVAAGDRDVALHGGGAIQQALSRGVLDELQVHIVPVLLQAGRQLFTQFEGEPINLKQVRVVESSGVTHLKYQTR